MARNNEYFELVDKYLNQELKGQQLDDFIAQLRKDEELAKEVRLQIEVAEAVAETDVMKLRASLKELGSQETLHNEEVEFEEEYSFGLAEEISYLEEIRNSFNNLDIEEIDDSMHKIHINQHQKASNETVHEVYRKDYEANAGFDEENNLSSEDERLFTEIGEAISERDITELRASLGNIATSLPKHQFETDDIEQYIDGEMNAGQLKAFEAELESNFGLIEDVELHTEINESIGESDIMGLRAVLDEIRHTGNSTDRSSQEIEQYIEGELSEEMVASFEEELNFNPDLATEVRLQKEVNEAIAESDVMDLRASLNQIRKEKEEDQEERKVASLPKIRKIWATVAACAVLALGIAGILHLMNRSSEGDIYAQNYTKYEIAGVVRSNSLDVDNAFKMALNRYNKAEYNEAALLFESLLQNNPVDPSGNFYAGVTYQEMKEYDKAIQRFEMVLRDEDNLFIQQAQWYIGLCYLETNQRRKAIEYLEQLANSESYYRKKAKKIVKILR